MWVRALGVVLGVLVVVALGWTAAETHYRACVEHAVAVTGTAFPSQSTGSLPGLGDSSVAEHIPTGTTPTSARRKAISGCSRSPF
jgi:hypothetical protein